MKRIRIRRLGLENFKCHGALSLSFGDGDAALYGDNGTGKSSVYDALTWLLFGRDSGGGGEKLMEVKPLDGSGNVRDHRAVTAVEAEFSVDGEPLRLRRTYREVWNTRRGTGEETFGGNTSEYYVDGVPCLKMVFDGKVGELVPEEVFRLLTSVKYFAGDLDWRKRREILFDMASVWDDRQILGREPRFAPLVTGMGKLTPDEYRKQLLTEKKRLAAARNEIPARISECRKTVEDLEHLDFGALRQEAEALQQRETALETLLSNHGPETEGEERVRELRAALRQLEGENRAHRNAQMAGTDDPEQIRRELEGRKSRIGAVLNVIRQGEAALSGYDREISDARERWITVSGEHFAGGSCPTCGQALPMEQLAEAAAAFETRKQERLREIQRTADSHRAAKEAALVRLEERKEEAVGLENEIARLRDRYAAALEEQREPQDLPGYGQRREALTRDLEEAEKDLTRIRQEAEARHSQLRRELETTREDLRRCREALGKESAIRYARDRIELLRQDDQAAEAEMARLERQLYLLEEYSRFKTRFVEERINGHFRIARFRLFRRQANGGLEDRCDVTCNGVPYLGLNSGMKINVGIDIINALSKHYAVQVPLFIDNAESVTKLEGADTQVIRLVVSAQDPALRLEEG